MKSGSLGDVTLFRALTMKLVSRCGLLCVLLALFVTVFVYQVRESPLLGIGRTDDLASVYQPMKVNPADLKPKRPVHTLSGDGEPEEEAGADSEEEEPAVVDPRSNNEEEESDDTGATTQSRASRDKMAAQDAEEATDDEEDYYPEIHLASVSCGNKRATGNIVTMLRTIATFLESDEYFISVHVVCDNEHLEGIRREVASWTAEILKRLHVSLYSTTIPKNMTTQLFNKMNSAEAGFECAFQKLFLSEILPRSVNHIMYIDADTLFLTPVEDVWKEIHNDLEKKHFIAAVKEYELDDVPDKQLTKQMQYKSPVPHFGNSGLNAGVVYMRLDALRETNFVDTVVEIAGSYRDEIRRPDQDVLNIYCARFKERCKPLNCSLNYRPETCTGCPDASEKGIAILLGHNGVFHNPTPDNTYRGLYQAYQKLHLPVSPELLLKVLLGSVRQKDCPPKSELFPRIEKLIWAGRLKKQGFEDDMYE